MSASEVALYSYLLHIGYGYEWESPFRLHSSEVCPQLMEKPALEKARKKLKEKGLIDFNASRSPRKLSSYTVRGCQPEHTDGDTLNHVMMKNVIASMETETPRERKVAVMNERMMVDAVERMWMVSDEECLDANAVAIYLYLLYEVERNLWRMPVKCKDYRLLALVMKKSALDAARERLARLGLISFDTGDARKDVPKYILFGIGSEKNTKASPQKSTQL